MDKNARIWIVLLWVGVVYAIPVKRPNLLGSEDVIIKRHKVAIPKNKDAYLTESNTNTLFKPITDAVIWRKTESTVNGSDAKSKNTPISIIKRDGSGKSRDEKEISKDITLTAPRTADNAGKLNGAPRAKGTHNENTKGSKCVDTNNTIKTSNDSAILDNSGNNNRTDNDSSDNDDRSESDDQSDNDDRSESDDQSDNDDSSESDDQSDNDDSSESDDESDNDDSSESDDETDNDDRNENDDDGELLGQQLVAKIA